LDERGDGGGRGEDHEGSGEPPGVDEPAGVHRGDDPRAGPEVGAVGGAGSRAGTGGRSEGHVGAGSAGRGAQKSEEIGMMDSVTDHFGELLAPFQEIWNLYQGLDPDQQQSALLLAVIGIVALIVWAMYQAHGDRVVIVLPAGVLRITLLLLVLPFVAVGRAAGRQTSVPAFLRESWTAQPDPERPQIGSKKVNPMKLPGKELPQNRWHLFDRDWERLYAVGVISKAGGGKDETLVGPALYHELRRGSSDVVVMDPKLEQLAAAYQAGYLPKTPTSTSMAPRPSSPSSGPTPSTSSPWSAT